MSFFEPASGRWTFYRLRGLEAVRDFMWEREKNRPGAVGDLLRTYVAYVSELQKEGRRRERTLAHGLGIEN